MTKLFISTDSTADLSEDLYKQFDIQIVRLGVIIGEETYSDGADITPEDIYNAMENLKIVPKTTAGLEADYEEIFKKSASANVPHIHISISSKLSASYSNAVRAANSFPNIYVIDSKSLSTGTGILAVIAREMANEGKPVEEITKTINQTVSKVHCSFVLDNLKYLHKGGRCSGLKLLGANLLSIHPLIQMENDGHLLQGKLFRGKFPAVVKTYVDYTLKKYPNARTDIAFVTHTIIDSEIERQVEQALRDRGFKRVFNTYAGSVITTHCGKSTIGIITVDL